MMVFSPPAWSRAFSSGRCWFPGCWLPDSSSLTTSVSLFFMKAITRLSTAAAAGVAVMSFVIRFGLLGLALVGVALALPEYFLTTAICFLLVYTLFLVFEIAVGLKGRTVSSPPAAGGEL